MRLISIRTSQVLLKKRHKHLLRLTFVAVFSPGFNRSLSWLISFLFHIISKLSSLLTATIKVHYSHTLCHNFIFVKHLPNTHGVAQRSHSVCRPCLHVFTPEPDCVWHLFQMDLFGPRGIFGDEESTEAKMRGEDVSGVVMWKPMIDIPISHLTRWGHGSDNELWHINELV